MGSADGSRGTDESGDRSRTGELRGRPATRRNRARSAALWGAVGFFSFLVLAQAYLLFGGDLPFRYAALFAMALVVAVASGGIAYLTEHRLVAKGRV